MLVADVKHLSMTNNSQQWQTSFSRPHPTQKRLCVNQKQRIHDTATTYQQVHCKYTPNIALTLGRHYPSASQHYDSLPSSTCRHHEPKTELQAHVSLLLRASDSKTTPCLHLLDYFYCTQRDVGWLCETLQLKV